MAFARLFASSVCLTIFLGCAQSSSDTSQVEAASQDEATANAADTIHVVYTDPTTVEISVPEMSCPHGCYPDVKEALEAQPNVASIELGTPAEETADAIEDRRVIVKTSGEFDVTAAVAAFPSHLQKGVEAQQLTDESSEGVDVDAKADANEEKI